MTNRIDAANDALADLLQRVFPSPQHVWFRNPDGQRAFDRAVFVVSMDDDEEPEIVNVLSGPVYDLKVTPVVTMASKGAREARPDVGPAIQRLADALAEDPSLGGVVEDARIVERAPAEMDREKWAGGGTDLSIRLLFAAPTAAG